MLPAKWLIRLPKSRIHINPTGLFVIGGPVGDCGLTGRKIIVDTYGGMARHGGGAFSGKDPSKVDRSATYAARYVAKNIVAAGIADKCEVQVSYAIGVARPTSISVTTFGTGRISDDKIEKLIRKHFDLTPTAFSRCWTWCTPCTSVPPATATSAASPWPARYSYETMEKGRKLKHKTGPFEAFTWEKTDKAEQLRKAARLKS